MKKIISAILTFALGAMLITGCSEKEDNVNIRVGSLSGPTTIGIVNLMDDAEKGNTANAYEFTVATQPDEVAAMLNNGSIDIALIPANLASVVYNKTSGSISVIDINTLGVLYCLSTDESISSVSDLSGKTVITTGQGATPEYAMNYLLEQYGVTDCTLDFRADGQEVIAALSQGQGDIAILPQPAATSACANVEGMKVAFSLNEQWDAVTDDSILVTGVTVVRNEFLEEHPLAVEVFLEAHSASAEKALSDVEGTAALVVAQGIVPAEPVAQKAIPLCNIVCITGEEMKADLSGYLQTLYDQNPQAVGGALPADDFYYVG